MWLQAPFISCTHGFSTRNGGVSSGPFSTLNLGGSEDDPTAIARNRSIALESISAPDAKLSLLKQVHGAAVCLASEGRQEGDAQVTAASNLMLAVSIADCYPVLFQDPVANVIGAAHAGWRGTVAGIAGKTVQRMVGLGASAENIRVAIGQGICREHFEVGPEVTEAFAQAGFPEELIKDGRIDLLQCIFFNLQQNGILPASIWMMKRCTYETDFFSYRRDKGVTGRMWAVIMQ